MANIIESRVTLEDEVFEETIDTMEEPIEVVRPSSYNDLEDLPQINGVTLTGNKTSEELGIVTATDIENAVSAEATLRENADTTLGGRIDGEKTARENADTALGGRIDTEITNRTNADNDLGTRIDNEILARRGGDNNLQTQIDAITSKSDVVDVVADYAALQAYDTQHLGNNDVIKVLDDETHNDAQTYYRWNKTAGTWSYIGSEAPYYSKGQIDQQMQAKQDKLTAGTGINLNGSTISADTTVLATKEDIEPEIVADLPAVGDPTKLYLTPTNKTASGNPITIDLKEDVGQMTSFRLDGNTYQQSYTGKNIIDYITGLIASGGGITNTINSDGTITTAGKPNGNYIKIIEYYDLTPYLEDGATYSLSSTLYDNKTAAQVRQTKISDSSNYSYDTLNSAKTFTVDKSQYVYRMGILTNTKSAWGDGPITITKGYQLEKSASATSFEPFVGGVPSPNPDYPQQIQTVTGLQTVEIVGKNLFDKDNMDIRNGYLYSTTFSYRTTNADRTFIVPCEPNTTYTISRSVITSSFRAAYIDLEPSEIPADASSETSLTCAGYIANNSGTSITITTSATAKSLLVHYGNTNTDGVTRIGQSVATIMVEKSASATTYAPYSKQTLPISLGSIELCKLGTYQDYIYKDGDDWKVHKATNKITVNGSENWVYPDSGANYTFFQFSRNNFRSKYGNAADFYASTTEVGFAKADKFEQIVASSVNMRTEQGIGFTTEGSGWLRISVANTIATTIEAFKAWLSSHPTTIDYALATATDTTITDTTLIAQLEAVRKATLANGQNAITNVATGENLAGSMRIGYYGYNPSEYSEWLYVNGAWEQVSGRPIPTKTSDLENDSDYATRDEVATKLQTVIVDELPTMGDEGKLYLTPKNYTTGTATGNPITISLGEDAGQITSAQLDGDTYQQSYTGKNLYKLDTGTYNELVITKNSEGGYVLNGTPTTNVQLSIDIPALSQEHTLSFSASGTSSRVYVRTRDSEGVLQDNLPITQTSGSVTSSKTIATSSLTVTTGETFSNFTIYPQLELGSSATSFEPYVGGTPSPNPDYPQPIQTVTGEQTVEVVGKNLFDIDSIIAGYELISATGEVRANAEWWVTPLIPVKAGEAYTSSNMRVLNKVFYNENGDFVSTITAKTATAPTGASYVRMNAKLTDLPNYTGKAQLELGSTASSYAPYSKQTLPLNLGSIELCKLGDYQDYIYKDGDDWKVHKAIATITVDGSEDWAYNGDNKFNAANISGMAMPINADALCYCATHIGVLSAQNGAEFAPLVADKPYATDVHKTLKTVRFKDIRFTTTTELQSWLSQNNTTIYYVVATATDTTITDQTLIAQLEAVLQAKLQASNTITNTATGTNLAGDLELGYYEYDPTNRYDKWLWLDLNNNYEKLGS